MGSKGYYGLEPGLGKPTRTSAGFSAGNRLGRGGFRNHCTSPWYKYSKSYHTLDNIFYGKIV